MLWGVTIGLTYTNAWDCKGNKDMSDRTKVTKKKKNQRKLHLLSPLLTWSPTEEPYAAEILESTSIFQSPAVLWQPPQLHR